MWSIMPRGRGRAKQNVQLSLLAYMKDLVAIVRSMLSAWVSSGIKT